MCAGISHTRRMNRITFVSTQYNSMVDLTNLCRTSTTNCMYSRLCNYLNKLILSVPGKVAHFANC